MYASRRVQGLCARTALWFCASNGYVCCYKSTFLVLLESWESFFAPVLEGELATAFLEGEPMADSFFSY